MFSNHCNSKNFGAQNFDFGPERDGLLYAVELPHHSIKITAIKDKKLPKAVSFVIIIDWTSAILGGSKGLFIDSEGF